MTASDRLPKIGFLTEWQQYAQQLEGETWRGERLDTDKLDKMSGESFQFGCLDTCSLASAYRIPSTDQQVAQLYELMQAIQKAELEENDPDSEQKP